MVETPPVGHRERLLSLAATAHALGRSSALSAMVELAAEAVREALGATTVKVSRLLSDGDGVRVLFTAGRLLPTEERWPRDEVYTAADYPTMAELLRTRRGLVVSLADPGAEPAEAALLRSMGRVSSLAAPLVVDGRMWGDVWATHASHHFDEADTAYLEALAALLGSAVSRALREEELERLASTDALTGLANRRALDDAAHRAVARCAVDPDGSDGQVSAVAIDVDGLKRVNDECGHVEGDRLLLEVAHLLREVSAEVPGSIAARAGGDEFVLLVPGAGPGEVTAIAERLRTAGRGLPHRASLSCGAASTGGHEPVTAQVLLQAADTAQLRAKRSGGDCVVMAAALA